MVIVRVIDMLLQGLLVNEGAIAAAAVVLLAATHSELDGMIESESRTRVVFEMENGRKSRTSPPLS